MTASTSAVLEGKRRRVLRTVGIALSVLMVVLMASILFLIFRTESAHDEASCPFVAYSERVFEGTRVREQMRRCVPEAEEHRWLIVRGGQQVEIGRKRLPRERFTPDRAKWKLIHDDEHEGKIILRIELDGAPFSEFREVDAPK